VGASIGAVQVGVLLSPLAPVGAVRAIAPDVGTTIDLTVLLGGAAALAVPLLAVLALLAHRLASARRQEPPRRRAGLAAALPNGLTTPIGLGVGFALDPGRSSRRVPVRATIVAGMVACAAVVASAIFAASLAGVVSDPERYGWAWDRTLIAQAGYGSLDREAMDDLVGDDRRVEAWSLLAFSELDLGEDETPTPAIGIDQRRGEAGPPVIDGRLPAAAGEVALGTQTLRSLDAAIGSQVVGTGSAGTSDLEVVGTVTFPSQGVGGTDNPSLGRGALLSFQGLDELVGGAGECGTAEMRSAHRPSPST